ncbi:Threonine synthase-like 1 [Mortierella sp. AM989]|nr:Threonine synthase-like 1 [Mortierella sp. AM989]
MKSSLARSVLSSARASRQQCRSLVPTTTARSLSNCAVSSSRNNCKGLDLLGLSSNKPLYNNNNNNINRSIHRSGPLFFSRPYHISIPTLERNSSTTPTTSDTTDNTKLDSTTKDDNSHIQPQHSNPIPPNTDPKARMLIGYTCIVCNHRAHKTMSKHAYNHGVVIMQCDHCKNRHLIADHLGWFKNGGVTVEDLVKEKGETVQKLTRSYQLVKDGQPASSSSTSSSIAIESETTITATSTKEDEATAATDSNKPKTELELALEKAAQGTLEWIPKDVLQDEEDRMRKSQELLDQSKKRD